MAAETLGILVGVAGLYSSCVDAFEHIHAARSLGRDYELLNTRFDVRKTRLLQWGEGVGLLGANDSERHPFFQNQQLRPRIESVLMCIKMLLTDADNFKAKYGLEEVTTIQCQASDPALVVSARRIHLFKEKYQQFQATLRRHQSDTPLLRKFQWAVHGHAGFEKLVADLGSLIEDLYHLVPIMPGFEILMIKEDLDAVQDLTTLKRVEEACTQESTSESQRRWLDAASSCVEASEASIRAQGCLAVVQWLATCESLPPPSDELANQQNFSSSNISATPKAIDQFLSSIWANERPRRQDFLETLLGRLDYPELSYLNAELQTRIRIDILGLLPKEIAVNILTYLDVQEIATISAVSWKWNRLAMSDRLWKRLCVMHSYKPFQD